MSLCHEGLPGQFEGMLRQVSCMVLAPLPVPPPGHPLPPNEVAGSEHDRDRLLNPSVQLVEQGDHCPQVDQLPSAVQTNIASRD